MHLEFLDGHGIAALIMLLLFKLIATMLVIFGHTLKWNIHDKGSLFEIWNREEYFCIFCFDKYVNCQYRYGTFHLQCVGLQVFCVGGALCIVWSPMPIIYKKQIENLQQQQKINKNKWKLLNLYFTFEGGCYRNVWWRERSCCSYLALILNPFVPELCWLLKRSGYTISHICSMPAFHSSSFSFTWILKPDAQITVSGTCVVN